MYCSGKHLPLAGKKTPHRGVFWFDTILIEVVLTLSVAIDWLVQALQYRPVQ